MADHKIVTRTNAAGAKRYTALYRGRDGWVSAGTFGDKRAALNAALAQVVKIEETGWIDTRSGKVTLKEYAETVYVHQMGVEASTQYSYEKVLHKHVLPHIGQMPLNRITTGDVQRYVLAREKEGFSAAYVRRMYMVLRQVLKAAVQDEVLRTNPCDGVRLPVVVDPEVKILSPEEFSKFMEHVPEHWRVAVEVAIETGMRAGEIRALAPDQIDFLRRTITVNRAINYIPGKGFVYKPYPKNTRPRLIQVTQGLIDLLAAQMTKRGLKAGDSSADSLDNLLIVGTRGRPFAEGLTEAVRDALAKAGLADRSLKHLRSSHCSWLLAGGRPLVDVQARMGHSHLKTTQRYIQTLPEAEEQNLAAFQAIRNRSNA